MVNGIIGYIIVINMIALVFAWLDIRTDIIKLKVNVKWVIYFILSFLGAAFAVNYTFKMFQYKTDDKRIKYIIPLIFLIQFVLVVYIFLKINNLWPESY